jgi:hypothetical protein
MAHQKESALLMNTADYHGRGVQAEREVQCRR